MTFTETDALEAIREALQQPTSRPEGAYTAAELQEMAGVGDRTIRRALRAMLAEGKVECIRIPVLYIDGRLVSTPAYRFVIRARRRKAA